MRIQVRAPARLHFGLLRVPAEEDEFWADQGKPAASARFFGGVGLMIEAPAVRVTVMPAAAWSAEGSLAQRALDFAQRFVVAGHDNVLPPMHLTVVQAPAEHSGLGTGTQLGLAVGRALALASGLPDPDITELARRVGRGRRSAIGVHGFAQGGFLVEGGKRTPQTLAPLLVRLPFPEMWRVLLILVGSSTGWHGDREQAAFRHLLNRPAALASTDTLCRLVLLGLLPALREQDLEEFGEALHDFNARAGETFAAVQGGTYASPGISDMISFIRRQGVRCVGQSSWGPAVFAVVSDEASAENLARRIRNHLGPGSGEVLITRACNEGATVVVTP